MLLCSFCIIELIIAKLNKAKKYILRFLAGILILIFGLLLLITLFLFIPQVQQSVSKKAAGFLENKIGTNVTLGGLYLDFPNGVSIEKLYLEDQQKDTLLYTGHLDVSIDYFALFHGEIEISDIVLKDAVANIHVREDSSFNFDYILNAFLPDTVSTTPVDTASSSSMAFDIGNIELENVHFTYDSKPDGLSTYYKVGRLFIAVDEFNPEEEIYVANEIEISNTSGKLSILKNVPSSPDTSSLPGMLVGSENLNLHHVDFEFESIPDDMKLITSVGSLIATAEPILLSSMKVQLNSIQLDSSLVDFSMRSMPDSSVTVAPTEEGEVWKVSAGEFDLSEFNFIFNDKAAPELERQMDFAHLNLKVGSLEANELYFNGIKDLGGTISELQASEQSGFKINRAALDLKMDSNQIALSNFFISTPNSTINAPTKLTFTDLEKIAEESGNLQFRSTLKNTSVGLRDISYFNPQLLDSLPLPDLAKRTFTIDGQVYGKIDNINLKQLQVSTAKQTRLTLNGKLTGLPDIDKLYFNLDPFTLSTTASDLRTLLGDSLIPSNINLPASINLKAQGKGDMKELTANLNLKTSQGKLSMTAFATNLNDSVNASYNLNIDMPSYQLGTLLNDTLLGNLGFKGQIKGRGLSPETLKAEIDASVKNFEYNKYKYADLEIDGLFEKETFDGKLAMNDSNLVFDFSGIARLDSSLPKFDFMLNLKAMDLQHLGFYNEDLRVRGMFDIDIEGNNLENLNGGLDIRDVLIIKNGEHYSIDSLLFISIIDTGYTDISIRSTIMDAEFKGKIDLADLPQAFNNHFAQYLGKRDIQQASKQQDFKFNIVLHDPDILTEVILPDLSHFETGDINGSFDSRTDKFDMNIYFSSINYADILIDSLYFISKSDPDKMTADLIVKKIGYDTLALTNLSINNVLQNDSLNSLLKIEDDSSGVQMQLAGALTSVNDYYRLKLLQNQQIINYDQWSVDPQNEINFKENVEINQLNLSHQDQKIALQSKENTLSAIIRNFELENIFDLIERNNKQVSDFGLMIKEASEEVKRKNDSLPLDTNKPLLAGKLNADLNFPTNTNGALNGSVDINNIEVQGIPIGNINANASTAGTGRTNFDASLKGKGNRLNTEGWLDGDEISMFFAIEKLKLKTIEAFSNGEIQNSEGYINGKGSFSSKPNDTEVSGALNFNEVSFRSRYLGQEFHFENERISLKNDRLSFERFTVLDSTNNPFSINGEVRLKDLTNPSFNLNISAKNFQFLNTSRENKNDLFYGKVFITADVDLTGDMEKPIVRAKVSLNKGTDISFVVPSTEAVSVNHEGIVEFVDMDNGLPALLREDKTIDTIRTDFEGVDLEAFLDINEQTKVTIVIDPVTGDRLIVRGGGKLRTTVDVAGNINMNGIYEIKDGNYELRLYNLVRRRFDLVPGSKIIWNGDPLGAKMNIEGMYTAKAAPIGLLGSQITSLTENERQQYKRKLPFEVILIIEGEIMEPLISFKLDLPEDDKGALGGVVLAKLQEINQNESELNKQVFSLIVLKRFFSQDPFASGGAGSNAARQSVSQLLNQQLNSLTDKYIKGVEIELNVDSYEDYNDNGELQGRTDLNVALSKQFFDERVKVRVNGDFGVENQQSNSNGIAGDISVEYKITEDGRYKMKFYRDNKYAGFIEGQLVETGVSLIFTKEYQKFKQLFQKPENVDVPEDEE